VLNVQIDGSGDANSYQMWIGPTNFGWSGGASGALTIASGGVHPDVINSNILAEFDVLYKNLGLSLYLDSITLYYNTNASGDDFDFRIRKFDLAGSSTAVVEEDNIGNGSTGAGSIVLTSANADTWPTDGEIDIAKPHYIIVDINNTDVNTDVIFYGAMVKGHFA